MATSFPIPPTYAELAIIDPVTKKASFNPIWLNWFLDFARTLQLASTGSTANHESLLGLQGGAVGEHFHFTMAEHALLQAFNHESLNGLQGGTSGEHFHFTNAQHTTLAAYLHNSLNSLQGGATNEFYHLTNAEHTAAANGPAQSVGSIIVPASGTGWHNTTGFNVNVVPSGGTVSNYALSRDNVTYFSVGLPTFIPVVRGDWLKTTYTVVPTLNYFAM